jgi:hypothetical protein
MEMNGKQLACMLSVLVLCLLAAPAFASEASPVVTEPQAAVLEVTPTPLLPEAVAVLAFLADPMGETCSSADDFLEALTVNECSGCSFEPPSFCDGCCGRPAGCIDTWDGGYCTCR